MSAFETMVVGDCDYVLVCEAGRIVGTKRYNKDHRMWVELRFSETERGAEEMLLSHLTAEYVKQSS